MRINFRVISVCFFMLTLGETGNSKDINNTNLDVDNLYCKDCNVLFLNIDLLRADHIGLLNIESPFTPNIDKFFKNSIIFEDVSSVSGVTAISNTSTLMSRDGVAGHLVDDVVHLTTDGLRKALGLRLAGQESY